MVSKSINNTETDGKGKIIIKLKVLDKTFEVVKLYQTEDKTYEEALEEAQLKLSDMIADGLPEGTNRKVKYLIDGTTNKKTKELRKENG